jgi:hypothetical protein
MDYKDLLFCPLDLPTPPVIDYSKFKVWYNEQLDFNKKHNVTALVADGKQEYPWEVSWALWWNTYDKPNPWICNFEKTFPELVEYFKLYPFKQFKSISFLDQKESRDVYLHTDPDNRWGMRFYLFNGLGEKLYFVKSKERLTTRLRTMVDNKYTDLWEHSQKEKLYAKFPEKRCAWMLNSLDAFHGIEKNPNPMGNRVTCVLNGDYDYKKLFELLERSVKKYKQYSIVY